VLCGPDPVRGPRGRKRRGSGGGDSGVEVLPFQMIQMSTPATQMNAIGNRTMP